MSKLINNEEKFLHISAGDIIDMILGSPTKYKDGNTIKFDANYIVEDGKKICYCRGYKIIFELNKK